MGSVFIPSQRPDQVQVHLWLQPRLHDFATHLAGADHYALSNSTKQELLSSLIRPVLRTRQAPPLPTEFTAQRRRFVVLVGRFAARDRGAWVHHADMLAVEASLKHHFYARLHAYVEASMEHGTKGCTAIRRWMDRHNIDAEHTDYELLHAHLLAGRYGFPPLRSSRHTHHVHLRTA